MEIQKKWIPTVLLTLGGIGALVVGIISMLGGTFLPDASIAHAYKNPKLFPPDFNSNITIAYIGGIAAIVIGSLSLTMAVLTGVFVYKGKLEENKIVLTFSGIAFAIILILCIVVMIFYKDVKS
ncbi:MAG: hypothetical protein KAG04_00700, partial [Mycoplasmataceae bacterium]|nr:hypothetical protein [Mycoplasmataceae bacterium]